MTHFENLDGTLEERIRACTKCELHKTRTRAVIGRGDPSYGLWFVGEAPGREEDETGLAFVGRSGRLLNLCNHKEGIRNGYIVNLLKCRPPENRNPSHDECSTCLPWLQAQLKEYKPKVIVALGRFSIGLFRYSYYYRPHILNLRITKEVQEVANGCKAFRPAVSVLEGLQTQALMTIPDKDRYNPFIVPNFHPAYIARNAEALPLFLTQLRTAKQLYARCLKQQDLP